MKRYSFRIVTAGIKEDILAICNQLGKDAEYFQELRETVKKYDQKYQVFAAWLIARDIEADHYVEAIQKYVDSRRITKLSVGAKAVKINDEVFDDAIKLTEYIHAQFPILQAEKQAKNNETEDVPVVANKDNSIKIFEINDANDGRRLVGDDTSWCIGYKGSNNMWQSYRDQQDSTFFVVFDDNPPTENQRKVAIDFVSGEYAGGNRVLLTDIPNLTGLQLSNGWDWNKYSEYLSSKGINLQATRQNPETGQEELILKNKPKTSEEILQNATFRYMATLGVEDILLWQSGKSKVNGEDRDIEKIGKNSLNIIEEISDRSGIAYIVDNPDAKFYTSRWMGLGKRIKDEVLEYLSQSVGGEDLLMKYVNTGMKLSETQYQFFRKNKSLLTTYLRNQIIGGRNFSPVMQVDLMKINRKDLFKQLIEKQGGISEFAKPTLEEKPDFLRIYLETLIENNNLQTGMRADLSDADLLLKLNDRDLLIKYISTVKTFVPNGVRNFIFEDPKFPELYLIYAKNRLTDKDLVDFTSAFPKKDLRNVILQSGDKSLIKEVAMATGFEDEDFEKAKELGVLEEVKYSILSSKPSEKIAKYYNPDDPFDLSLINQIKNVDVLREFSFNNYDEYSETYHNDWSDNPTISFAFDLKAHEQAIFKDAHYAFQDRPQEMIPNNANQTLLWAIYNDGKLFKKFEELEMSDETKEDFRDAIQEFQNASQDINFWKNFFKNTDHFADWIGGQLFLDKNDYAYILKFIPQEFLEDPEIKEFLQRKMNNITAKNFIKNIDIEKTPWLFEDYINQFIEGSNDVYSEFRRLLNYDQDFAFEFLSKIFEKKKLTNDEINYFEALAPDLKFEFLDLYTHYYPEVKEDPNFYNLGIFSYFRNRPNLNHQLHLLRNYPKYFETRILERDVYVDILPEIRAALVHMYPNLAPKILAYERKSKYGNGYFDEESGQVMKGKRPTPPGTQKELPDPFASEEDEEDEEEELTTAFVKSMVKIAQKLDYKRAYNLADKFTNILRKYNV
jgi:hypothetical protein